MNKKEDILYLIESETFPIVGYKDHYININNNSLNKDNILNAKRKLLIESIKHLTNELVSSKQQYPENDIAKVDLELDCIIIKRKHLQQIINYIEYYG